MTLHRFFALSCLALNFLSFSLEAGSHKNAKHGFRDFQIDLINPVYAQDGLFSSKGGVVWSDDFRLQATQILHKEVKGESVIEADGQIMLFINGHLLTGSHIVFNMNTRSGVLDDGAIGFGNWCVGGRRVRLFPDQSIQIEKAWISSDPSQEDSWQVSASRVVLEKSQRLKFRNLSVRFLGMPIFILPKLVTTPQSLQHQPVEYNIVWKGSKKRKAGLRYRFYNSDSVQLWTRLEYLVGRGPGLGIDGQVQLDGSTLRLNNFVARDNSTVDPDLKTRYRFKGHYERPLSSTASLNLFYDRYSDNNVPSDYSYTPFDSLQEGQTKIVVRDQKTSFIHQLTHQVKINPFQTVKKQLPSYFYTPHSVQSPWQAPWKEWMSLRSHARVEYLSYDFRDQSALNNYHSSRLMAQGFADIPTSLYGLQVTPSVGYILSHYNKTADNKSVALAAPVATFNMQMLWSKPGYYTHCVQPFFKAHWVGDPLKTADEHYIFDYRDAITKQQVNTLGFAQNWYRGTKPIAGVTLQSVWIRKGKGITSGLNEEKDIHYEAQLQWNVSHRWKLLSEAAWGPYANGRQSWNIRSEHTWSKKLASAFEYRMRNSRAWRKNVPDDFSLESYRSQATLENSSLSDSRKTILTQWIYNPTPNWALRFDTAHGWHRKTMAAYNQYCMGISTDLGASWRLQLQVSKTPEDWDWRIRIDLRDTPVVAPKPRF